MCCCLLLAAAPSLPPLTYLSVPKIKEWIRLQIPLTTKAFVSSQRVSDSELLIIISLAAQPYLRQAFTVYISKPCRLAVFAALFSRPD